LIPPTETQLKALQVKAELSKLGDAPRAYFEKLQNLNNENVSLDMQMANISIASR
jgi:hypothetical protein